jgi:hypothetical protein
MDSPPCLYRILGPRLQSLYPEHLPHLCHGPLGNPGRKSRLRAKSCLRKDRPIRVSSVLIFPGKRLSCRPHRSVWQERDKAKAQRDDALSRAILNLDELLCMASWARAAVASSIQAASSITLRGQWIMLETKSG